MFARPAIYNAAQLCIDHANGETYLGLEQIAVDPYALAGLLSGQKGRHDRSMRI